MQVAASVLHLLAAWLSFTSAGLCTELALQIAFGFVTVPPPDFRAHHFIVRCLQEGGRAVGQHSSELLQFLGKMVLS